MISKRVVSGAVVLVSGLVVSMACGGSSSSTSTPSATAGSSSAGNTAAQFGVPECDDYIQKYLACIEKMPGGAQSGARTTLDSTREQWKQAAATEAGKSALAMTCKAAVDSARTATTPYGCTW
jgi:hypothetical protein